MDFADGRAKRPPKRSDRARRIVKERRGVEVAEVRFLRVCNLLSKEESEEREEEEQGVVICHAALSPGPRPEE